MYHIVKEYMKIHNWYFYIYESKVFWMNLHVYGYHLNGTGTGTMIEHLRPIDSIFNVAFTISTIAQCSKKSCQGTNNHQEYWFNCSWSSWHCWRLLLDDTVVVPIISFFGNLIKTAVKRANILYRTNHIFVFFFRQIRSKGRWRQVRNWGRKTSWHINGRVFFFSIFGNFEHDLHIVSGTASTDSSVNVPSWRSRYKVVILSRMKFKTPRCRTEGSEMEKIFNLPIFFIRIKVEKVKYTLEFVLHVPWKKKVAAVYNFLTSFAYLKFADWNPTLTCRICNISVWILCSVWPLVIQV